MDHIMDGKVFKTICSIILISIIIGECFSYCPPLEAPKTTYLRCEEPTRRQRLNCSSSWLPHGTSAYFKCSSISYPGSIAKGKIICFEDGMHRHVRETKGDKHNLHLPCGIIKNYEAREVHIYGYEDPIHYKLDRLGESETDFHQLAEILHNEFRSKHASPPLVIDKQLSNLAQSWADQLVITGSLDMAPDQHYGQNIFKAKTENLTAAVNDAIQNWYHSGLAQYSWEDVTRNWHNPLALQFSQLIWKSSKHFGIGAAPGRNSTVVIAFYDPSGNTIVNEGQENESENLFISNVPQKI